MTEPAKTPVEALADKNAAIKIAAWLAGTAVIGLLIYFISNPLIYYWTYGHFREQLLVSAGLGSAWASAGAALISAVYLVAFSAALKWLIFGRANAKNLVAVVFIFSISPILDGLLKQNFTPDGKAQRYYSVGVNGEYFFDNEPGVDPRTGREKKLVTPEIIAEIDRRKLGLEPKRVWTDPRNIEFFDTITGHPKIWYAEVDGEIELYDNPGFTKASSRRLIPITPTLAEKLIRKAKKEEEARRKADEERQRAALAAPAEAAVPQQPAFSEGTASPTVNTQLSANFQTRTEPRSDPRRPITQPPYPDVSKRRGEEGEVILSFEVLDSGNLGQIQVEQSSGFSRLDDAAVKEAKRNWRFIPATQDGQPVAAWHRFAVIFSMNSERSPPENKPAKPSIPDRRQATTTQFSKVAIGGEDRKIQVRTASRALENGAAYQRFEWTSPTGMRGEATPYPSYRNESGEICRKLHQTFHTASGRQSGYIIGCKTSTGSWRIRDAPS